MEKVVKDDIIEFEALRLIDSEAKHVAEDFRDIFLGTLISHYDNLVATELRGC